MKIASIPAAQLPLSTVRIVCISTISATLVGLLVLLSQFMIYRDWLHRTGPLRVIGTIVSATLTFLFVYRWLCAQRQQQLDNIKRFDTIAKMNDRIRNSLQVIASVTYLHRPDAIQPVWEAVDAIDEVLCEVSVQMRPAEALPPEPKMHHASISRGSS